MKKIESDFDPIFREPKIGELNLIWTRQAQHILMQKMVPKSEPHHPKISQKVKHFFAISGNKNLITLISKLFFLQNCQPTILYTTTKHHQTPPYTHT